MEDPRRRHASRERALELLYEADAKHVAPGEVVDHLAVAPDPFTVALLDAVERYGDRADALIADAATNWAPERMAVIDRLVLRLATAELLQGDEPPVAVVLDEAVELAKTYSTDDSGRFVNGVLSAVALVARPRPTS